MDIRLRTKKTIFHTEPIVNNATQHTYTEGTLAKLQLGKLVLLPLSLEPRRPQTMLRLRTHIRKGRFWFFHLVSDLQRRERTLEVW